MTHRVRRGAGAFALALALLAGAALAAAPALAAEGPQTRLTGMVNVNTATPEQLELLPGIGPARARAIVDHRKQHGPFRKVDDLVQVSGIGDKALARIRPHCAVSGKTTAKLEQ